jgi:hypothetical protein
VQFNTISRLDRQSGPAIARDQKSITSAGRDQDQRQYCCTCVSDLVCDGKHDGGKKEMQERASFAVGELEEREYQSGKTGDRDNIKKCSHSPTIWAFA